MKSQRDDGRGHWPAGKRRNPDTGDWQRTRIAVAGLLSDHPRAGVRSHRVLALHLGVSDITVRRWVQGEDRPPPDTQEWLRYWVDEQRQMIRREKKRSRS